MEKVNFTIQELKNLPYGSIIVRENKVGFAVYQKTACDTFSVTLVRDDGSNVVFSGKYVNDMPLENYFEVAPDFVKQNYKITGVIARDSVFYKKN